MKLHKFLSMVIALSMIAALIPVKALAYDPDDDDCSHNWVFVEQELPDCEDYGYSLYECSICGEEEERDIVPALGHDFSDVVTVPPTCDEEGYSYIECSRCDEVKDGEEFDKVPALGHLWGDWEIDEPTCDEPGWNCRYCQRYGCDECEEQRIEPLGHIWTEWTTISEPSCEDDGEKERYCTREGCGERETRRIIAPGHDWQVVQGGKYEAPTCEEHGRREAVCGRCGEEGFIFDGDPLGHDWGAWTVTEEPTFCTEGEKVRTCGRCGETEEEDIPELDVGDHDWEVVEVVPPTCEDDGYTLYECTRCGYEEERDQVDALGGEHEWVETKIVPPTCTEDGYTVYVCSRCGLEDHDDETDELGHNFVNGFCSRCGEPDPADSCITVEKYSLTLDSDIGVNFLVRVPAALRDDVTPVFTFMGKDQTASLGSPMPGTTDRYLLTYRVVPKDMGNVISLKMVDGNGSKISLIDPDDEPFRQNICNYSVIEYCDSAQIDFSGEEYKYVLNLVDALHDYGYYAQEYFGSGDEITEAFDEDSVDAVSKQVFDGHSITLSGDDIGIRETAMSLLLKSRTSIRHRFVLEEGHSIDEFTFTCSGKKLIPEKRGNCYCVTIEGIAAQDLDEPMTIVVTSSAASGEYTVTSSALAYCRLAMDQINDGKLHDLLKAMYLYNKAANEYCAHL